MADLIVQETADEFAKRQLSLYMLRPELFPEGVAVIETRINGNVLLVSDGTAANLKAATAAQVLALISNGRPAGYNATTKLLPADAPMHLYDRLKWNSIKQAANEDWKDAQGDALT